MGEAGARWLGCWRQTACLTTWDWDACSHRTAAGGKGTFVPPTRHGFDFSIDYLSVLQTEVASAVNRGMTVERQDPCLSGVSKEALSPDHLTL